MIKMTMILAMAASAFGLSGCSLFSGPTRYGERVVLDTAAGPTMAVRVLPAKLFWRKPGATYEEMDAARVECTSQLRSGGEYVDLLKESEPITLASMDRVITRAKKKRRKEINRRLGELYGECMAGKGYEYVRRGFPVEW